jgi:hypothetical protein
MMCSLSSPRRARGGKESQVLIFGTLSYRPQDYALEKMDLAHFLTIFSGISESGRRSCIKKIRRYLFGSVEFGALNVK